MARISAKNQVTPPVAALEEAGLHAGEHVRVEPAGDGELRIRRATLRLTMRSVWLPPSTSRRISCRSTRRSCAPRAQRASLRRRPNPAAARESIAMRALVSQCVAERGFDPVATAFPAPRRRRPSSGGHRRQSPGARDTLQLVLAAVIELESRARNEIDDGARHEYLARASQC